MNLKKWALVLLLCFYSLTAFADSRTNNPKEIITHFYQSYFLSLQAKHEQSTPKLDFSTSFKKLLESNKKLCLSFADEICGWGADGDVYLNAQDYDDSLTIENSHFKISEVSHNLFKVSFNLFPFDKTVQSNDRIILYKMIYEQNNWVIDDIIYDKNNSARKQIKNENNLLINTLKDKQKGARK
jgi:hypothetical protein